MATKQFYHNIDLVKVGQLLDARIKNVTSAEKSTLAAQLGSGNKGLVIYDTDVSEMAIWDGVTFRQVSSDITGDVIFRGVINPTNSDTASVEAVNGNQYVADTAGTLVKSGVTFSPSAQVEVGDIVLFTGTTSATVLQRNVDYATETVAGIIELATQAEVDAGTDVDRAITPATLAGSQLASDVAQNATDIAAAEALIGQSADAYLTLDTTAQTVIAAINEVNAAQLADSDRVAGNDSDIAALQGRATVIETRLDGHDSDIADLKDVDAAQTVRLDSADTRFVAVETRVSTNEADILALQGADSDLDARLDVAELRLDSADTRFVAVETRVSETERRLDSADDRFVAAESRITQNELDIATLEGVDSDFADRMDSADTRMVAIETRLTGHDTDISTLQGVDSDIKAFVGFSETLDTSASTLVAAINELHGEINSNDADILALQGRVTTLESRDNVKVHTDQSVSILANTPKTVNHALALANATGFVINVMDSDGSQISVDVDAVDANNLTLTSLVALSGVKVTVMGV